MSYSRDISGLTGIKLTAPTTPFANVFGTDVEDATIVMGGKSPFLTLTNAYDVKGMLGQFGNAYLNGGEELDITVGYGGVVTGKWLYDSFVTIGEGGVGSFMGGSDLTILTTGGKWGEGITLALDKIRGDVTAFLTENAPDIVGIVLPEAGSVDDIVLDLGSSSNWRGDGDTLTISPATGGGSATMELIGFDPNDTLIFATPKGAESMELTTFGMDVAAVVRGYDPYTGEMVATVTTVIGAGPYNPDGMPVGHGGKVISNLFEDAPRFEFHVGEGYNSLG